MNEYSRAAWLHAYCAEYKTCHPNEPDSNDTGFARPILTTSNPKEALSSGLDLNMTPQGITYRTAISRVGVGIMVEPRVVVFNSEAIDQIEKCEACEESKRLQLRYDGLKRAGNCRAVNAEAPAESKGLSVILLGQTPPPSGLHIMNRMDPKAGGGDSLASRVARNLRSKDERLGRDLDTRDGALAKKGHLLDAITRNGYTLIDCCHCSVPRSVKGSKKPLLRYCFQRHSHEILVGLCRKYPDAVVQPYFETCCDILEEKGDFCRVNDDGPFGSWKLCNGNNRKTV